MNNSILKNEVAEVALDEIKGCIDVKGVLRIKDEKADFACFADNANVRLFYGCELYINNVLYVGKEYTHNAYISLGHGRTDKDPDIDPIITINKEEVVVDGKVYFNKELPDERKWDLGLDSAVFLYADNKIKFYSSTKEKFPTAAIYTYGGVNNGVGAEMSDRNALYFLLGEDRVWTNIYAHLDKFAPTLFGVIMEMNGIRTWNGKMQIDTETGEDGKKIADLSYTERKGNRNTYDLWLPKYILDSTEKGKDVPVILFVHGGSWSSGKKEDEEQGCLRYAKQGYVTATVNTRLAFQQNPDDNGTFFDMIADVKDCVSDIVKQLESYGYHSTRMALSGGSSGGHISMLYAAVYGEASPIPVKLVMPRCAPSDFTPESWANNRNLWQEQKRGFDGKVYDPVQADPEYTEKLKVSADFMGKMLAVGGGYLAVRENGGLPIYTAEEVLEGYKDETSEMYAKIKSISPTLLWDKYRIPCVFRHGEPDTIVSVECAKKLKTILEELGVDHCCIVSSLDGHIQIMDRSAAKIFYEQCQKYLDKYLPISL